MRIKLICPDCTKLAGGVGTWFVEDIRDDGLYTGKCPNGHDLLIATQTLRHEMLFEIALNAIVDKYYREAVSSFAASMERYFEFAVRVISNKHTIPTTDFNDAWKELANQSQRQLGAYIILYLIEFGKLPKLLTNNMTTLRNNIVHKGLLPDREKALEFGKDVYAVIQEGIRQLRETHLDSVNKVLGERVAEISEKMGTRYPRTFQVTSTALNVIEDISTGYKPFDQLLSERGIELTSTREPKHEAI